MAYAAARMAESTLLGLAGEPAVYECAFVDSEVGGMIGQWRNWELAVSMKQAGSARRLFDTSGSWVCITSDKERLGIGTTASFFPWLFTCPTPLQLPA